jgi:hypothetical protein
VQTDHLNRLHYEFMCEHTVRPRGERVGTCIRLPFIFRRYYDRTDKFGAPVVRNLKAQRNHFGQTLWSTYMQIRFPQARLKCVPVIKSLRCPPASLRRPSHHLLAPPVQVHQLEFGVMAPLKARRRCGIPYISRKGYSQLKHEVKVSPIALCL